MGLHYQDGLTHVKGDLVYPDQSATSFQFCKGSFTKAMLGWKTNYLDTWTVGGWVLHVEKHTLVLTGLKSPISLNQSIP